jgi:hypothetical protein
MRTVTFSNHDVQEVLNHDFVCFYTDTTGDPSAGASFQHAANEPPGPCGRGAGRQNVQTLFLTPDGEIFHVVTGFISPDELIEELSFSRNLFAKLLKGESARAAETTVAEHQRRLRTLEFSPTQITSQSNFMTDLFLSGPNPQDFGMNVPGMSGTPFQDIDRQRILRDSQFVIAHPLMTREEFEQDPGELVGHHKSFFGSHSMMNGIGEMMGGNNGPRIIRRSSRR